VSAERGESEGEAGDAGEGEGAARDTEQAPEELEDPLPGIPPPHKTVKNRNPRSSATTYPCTTMR